MKIRTKAPNFALTKEINENTDKSTKFWLKVWQNWGLAREYMILTLRSIQFFHANNKQVIIRCVMGYLCLLGCARIHHVFRMSASC